MVVNASVCSCILIKNSIYILFLVPVYCVCVLEVTHAGRRERGECLFTLAATQGGNELTSKRECSGIVKRVCAPCMSYQTLS